MLYAAYYAYFAYAGMKAFEECPLLVMIAFGGQFLQAQIRMLVTIATFEDFRPFRRTHFMCWLLMGFQVYTGGECLSEMQLFGLVSLISWTAHMHQVIFTLREMQQILDLPFITIKPKNKLDKK